MERGHEMPQDQGFIVGKRVALTTRAAGSHRPEETHAPATVVGINGFGIALTSDPTDPDEGLTYSWSVVRGLTILDES